MSTQEWLETVWHRTQQAGLPREYSQRLLLELRDHAECANHDLSELGAPEQVATAAVRGYRSQRWFGRYPLLGLVILPLLLTPMCWTLYIDCGIWFVELIGGAMDPVSLMVSHVLVFLSRFVPPLTILTMLWWCFRYSGRSDRWFLAGLIPVTCFAGLYWVQFDTQAMDGPNLWVEFRTLGSWWQVPQAAAVLIVACLLIRCGCVHKSEPDFGIA